MSEVRIINGLEITIHRNFVKSKTDIVDAYIKLIEREIQKEEEEENAIDDS